MRSVNKIVFVIHRILGTLLSAVFLMWFLTGLVMLYHGHFPRADKSKKMELISATAGELPPVDSLAKGIAFSDMSVERYLGTTTFRISSPDTLVEVNEKCEPVKVVVDEARLEKVRKAWCKADVAKVDTLKELNQWVPFGRNEKELPIIRYTFADEDEHELYVGSKSGDALQFTSHEQRVWAWLGPIPHWVYFTWLRSDQELWCTTVIWISGIGCLMVISGLWTGIVVWSRARKNKKVRFSPYKKKWYHWHYVTGLVFGIFCLTYVFSGMMSLADVPAFVSESKLDFKPQFELMAVQPDSFRLDYRKVLAAEPQATSVEWKHVGRVPFYSVQKKDGKSAYYDARDTSLVALQLSENEVLDLVKDVYKSHNVDVGGATAETQDFQELYYRVHSRGEAILPVVKVTMNDEDNGVFYINPKNGNVRYVDTTGRWAYWMYPALHKLRLPGIVDAEWLRLLLSWIVLLGGAAVSLTGVVLGCRYIGRLVKYRPLPPPSPVRREPESERNAKKQINMKKIVTIIFLCLMTVMVSAQKSAILVVQFGTSNDEGRAAALDALYGDIKTRYPQYEVREAYASSIIRKILAKKNIKKDSATDALLRLHLDGYDKVYVMPTFLLDGVEMNMLRDDVRGVEKFFKELKVGNPVLYRVEDFHAVADLLTKRSVGKKEAVMYVGHGNKYSSTAAYSMLCQIMKQKGSYFVGTIEGWPDLDASVDMVDTKAYKQVSVVPMLLASGVHVREDIDGEWRPAFEKKGFKVDVTFKGLGEDKAFREFIISHLEELLKD